ncbi:hypothetical protein Gorai_004320, partial [Gossypium raimondii]|nr:hypothetical protein [Gossypium raimondii]
CHQTNEDLEHIHFHFSFAIVRWHELGFTLVVTLLEDFITQILAEQQEDKRRRVSGMIWGIWFNMNEAVRKQNVMTVDQLVHHVDEFMHCWLGVWTIHSTQLVSRTMVEGGDVC